MNRLTTAIMTGVLVGAIVYAARMTQLDIKHQQELEAVQQELETTQQELADYKADELEIYPCPFCGSENVIVRDTYDNGEDCYVKCEDCYSSGPSNNPDTGSYHMSKADAIEWWNHNARE